MIYIDTFINNEKIFLHSSKLNITETYLNQKKAICDPEENGIISVYYPKRNIQPGEHTLRFKFEGQLKEAKNGFIKAPFNGKQNS